MPSPEPRGGHEAAGISRRSGRCRGCVAARCAGATARARAAHRRALGLGHGHPDLQARLAAFQQGLQQLGWTDGRNVRIDYRWGAGSADNMRKYAAELVALAPDVILATGPTVGQLLQATRTVPIVFVITPDPVGSGFVDSLSRPGGNATGFMLFEYSLSAKWLELLKADRAGRDARGGPSRPCHNLRGRPVRRHPVRGAIGRHRSEPGQRARRRRDRARRKGLRALPEWRPDHDGESVDGSIHRDLVITLAAQHKLPAVYYNRCFVDAGGLISYGLI